MLIVNVMIFSDFILSKYLHFVAFHFQIIILMLILLVSRLQLLVVDLDLVCLLELKQNHAMKKEDMNKTMKLVV